jgi:hypothetical protein
MNRPDRSSTRTRGRFVHGAKTALATAVLTLLASPEAQACSSCFNITARGRGAYYGTTVLLLLLPFALLGGLIIWLRRAAKRAAESPEGAPGRPRADTAEQSAPS